MKNISDIIEEFILEQLTDGEIDISRNELAGFFNCAPSQINYVLSTRFTPTRGYDTTSKRGGGGYIRVIKLSNNENSEFFNQLLMDNIGEEIDYNSACNILENLYDNSFINEKVLILLRSVISNKSLASPIKNEGFVRAKILKNIIVELMKE